MADKKLTLADLVRWNRPAQGYAPFSQKITPPMSDADQAAALLTLSKLAKPALIAGSGTALLGPAVGLMDAGISVLPEKLQTLASLLGMGIGAAGKGGVYSDPRATLSWEPPQWGQPGSARFEAGAREIGRGGQWPTMDEALAELTANGWRVTQTQKAPNGHPRMQLEHGPTREHLDAVKDAENAKLDGEWPVEPGMVRVYRYSGARTKAQMLDEIANADSRDSGEGTKFGGLSVGVPPNESYRPAWPDWQQGRGLRFRDDSSYTPEILAAYINTQLASDGKATGRTMWAFEVPKEDVIGHSYREMPGEVLSDGLIVKPGAAARNLRKVPLR